MLESEMRNNSSSGPARNDTVAVKVCRFGLTLGLSEVIYIRSRSSNGNICRNNSLDVPPGISSTRQTLALAVGEVDMTVQRRRSASLKAE